MDVWVCVPSIHLGMNTRSARGFRARSNNASQVLLSFFCMLPEHQAQSGLIGHLRKRGANHEHFITFYALFRCVEVFTDAASACQRAPSDSV